MNAETLYARTNVCVEPDVAHPGFTDLSVGMDTASLDPEQAVEVARLLLLSAGPPEPMTHADLMAIVADDGKEGPNGAD